MQQLQALVQVKRRFRSIKFRIDRLDVSQKTALLKPYAVTLHNDIINVELPESLKTLIFPLQEHQANEVESIRMVMGPKHVTKIITGTQMAVSRQ